MTASPIPQSERMAYFGYGSLVNLQTLRTPFIAAIPARVTGWRRCWLARPEGVGAGLARTDLAFLSVRPDAGTVIEGLVVVDHLSSLAALDAREALYARQEIPVALVEAASEPWGVPSPDSAFLYVADAPPAQTGSILRSYLDAVMQGYLTQFGEAGLERFVATTDNFGLPVLEDRDAPIYPRAVVTTPQQRALFDALVPPR